MEVKALSMSGTMVYDFFKTGFPGSMNVELEGKFTDGMTVRATCTLTHVKETLICRYLSVTALFGYDSWAKYGTRLIIQPPI